MAKNKTDRDARDDSEFSVGMDVLKLSPLGLLQSAKDWLASAKTERGYVAGHAGLVAAEKSLALAPEIFVGAEGPQWTESPRFDFWRAYFEAKKQGVLGGDFQAVMKSLDKKALAIGAKHMLIECAKARDEVSFEQLLGMGAARRSKLVMFSAYQNGGKSVAEKVKQPTALEAKELIELGGAGRWGYRSERSVGHEWEGLAWLLGKIDGEISARHWPYIAALSVEPDLMERVIGHFPEKIGYTIQQWSAGAGGYVEKESAEQKLGAPFSLMSAGCPKAAKMLAIAQGGEKRWIELCKSGASTAETMSLVCLDARGNGVPGEVAVGVGGIGFTMQAAASLSGSLPVCQWLRAEYEKLGAAWLSGENLAKALKRAAPQYRQDPGPIIAKAISLSEHADLRLGLEDAMVKKTLGRAKSL